MSKDWSLQFGGVTVGTDLSPVSGRPRSENPFRILIIGNLSGRAASAEGVRPPGRERRPVRIDRDNFEEVLQRLGGRLEIPLAHAGLGTVTLSFRELDDFHPDRLLEHVSGFQTLRELRRKLQNPATFAEAAAEVRRWGASPSTPPATPAPAAEQPTELTPEQLLEQMLSGTPTKGPVKVAQPEQDIWQAYLQKIVQPHLLPKTDPDLPMLLELVDQAIGTQIRALLHAPAFQAHEAAWRGLSFLTRRLETDGNLQLFLLDLSREEMAADLQGREDLKESTLYRVLIEETLGTPEGIPWAVVGGLYTFGSRLDEVDLLIRLGLLARRAGAPFVAGGSSRLVQCASFAETPDPSDWELPADPEEIVAWSTLRQMPEAAYLGLALPRFLLRMPYGKESDATESFAFEELPEDAGHEEYLWGSPALACALLLGQSFTEGGWGMRPGTVLDISGLPLHVRTRDGDRELAPCAEIVLRERAIDRILAQGLMPLLSIQRSDRVRLGRFQSLADPPAPLAGPWE